MALFNFKAKFKNKTKNRAGGDAYVVSPQMELASLVLTSFAQEQFYRTQAQTFEDLKAAMSQCTPDFVAKAGIYARTQYGMRSITHVLAAELAQAASGQVWSKAFYDKIVNRPDDMLEIAAYFMAQNKGKNLPNAMKKGFAAAFNRFDTYQLAKYRGGNKAVKLVDLVNLVRPVPTTRNAEGLTALVNDTLRQTETWEAKLSEAGQMADTDTEKALLKADVWAELIEGKRLGYFALLRNLRNIMGQAPQLTPSVCAQLTDRKAIKNSMVLPFRFLTAYKQLVGNDANTRMVRQALDKAINIACDNVPVLNNTLVVIDNSGSMCSAVTNSTHLQCSEAGAIFGMILAKNSNADVMEFGDTARYIQYDLNESVMKFGASFAQNNRVGHGTNFHAIFEKAKKSYDRIVIFSDMQGWLPSEYGYSDTQKAFNKYKQRIGANPFIYSFDLRGYGSLQIPEDKVFALAGFSEKTFDLFKILETDRNALVSAIEAVEL